MKTMKFYMGISLLAVLLLFSGCGKELDELPAGGSNTESPENPEQAEGEQLRLRVSDAGFRDGKTGSRATDSGLTTTFEDGDKIGLFVVNSQKEVLYANVPYTKSGEEWTAEQNVRTKGYPVRVFAYYPYVADAEIVEKINKEADNASDFFANYIKDLNISDQSTQELYRKADVMACMVTVENKEAAREKLTLSMNHLMGLLVIDFPEEVTLTKVRYYLKGDESHSWLGTKLVTCPFESSDERLNIHAYPNEKGYSYLCRSNQAVSFSGSFTTYGIEKSYSVSDATVSAGLCKTYNITINPFEPASPALEEYTPQVGDFYMNDGRILPSISEDDKADCIGIVYWVPTATDPLNSHSPTWLPEYSTCTHGLVVGLKQQDSRWGTGGETTNISDSDTDGIFRGYSNTQRLVREHSGYAIVSAYNDLKKDVTLPLGTSGWYVPSVGELVKLSKVFSTVNSSLSNLNSITLSTWFNWSSGETSSSSASKSYQACCVHLSTGEVVCNSSKTNLGQVRLVFAF